MSEIKSDFSTAAGHSQAISGAAAGCISNSGALGGGAQNQPENSMINSFNALMNSLNSLGSAISSDGGNIEAVGKAISEQDSLLGNSFNLLENE